MEKIKVCFKDIQEVLKYDFDFVDFANKMCNKIYKKDFDDCVEFYQIINVKKNTINNSFCTVPMIKDYLYNCELGNSDDLRGLAVLFIKAFEKKYTKITPKKIDMDKRFATYTAQPYQPIPLAKNTAVNCSKK